ncbi:MAG: serine/threonine-protein kinase [Gemmatimonadota bacterium]|nr:MAG: serine/threonine-protein kinase [Gemmatimonadota bacterium]
MADILDRLKAALANRYTIECQLGAGGMAAVYLAEDLKHHRKVAIKVLRSELSASLFVERFLREIEIAANLNHPHILPMHDSGEADGSLYYVMPYVEGESLRDRLSREKQLPVDVAVRIACEVADALAFAHGHNVIHRDVKPENILLEAGHAVVADFGIARAVTEAGGERLTETGIAVGTPSYLSPEQAVGQSDLDGRSDVYSLGCVLHEMLTGEPPFTGPTAENIIRKHVSVEPTPVSVLRPTVSDEIALTVQRALAKSPADRFATAEEFGRTLNVALVTPTALKVAKRRRPVRLIGVAALLALALAVLSVALGRLAVFGREETIDVVRTSLIATEQGARDPALSPDGRLLAYAADEGIYVSQVEGAGAINLTGGLPDHPHRWPQWSPDGEWIAYEASGSVYVISALGGAPRRLTEGTFPSWSPDGQRIAFVRQDTLLTLALDATTSEVVGTAYRPHSPAWSPDGSRLAYVAGNPGWRNGNLVPSAIVVADLGAGTEFTVTDTAHINQSPQWDEHGRGLFFVSDRQGTLATGEAYYRNLGRSGRRLGALQRLTVGADVLTLSATPDGRYLAYSDRYQVWDLWAFPIRPGSDLIRLSQGRRIARVPQPFFDIAPDGGWLVVNGPLKVLTADGSLVQLGTRGMVPSPSPDGREIAFFRFVDGNRDLFVMSADGRDEVRLTGTARQDERAPDWSPDGGSLVFSVEHIGGRYSLHVISRSESDSSVWESPRRILDDGGWNPRWSPDGHMIAFVRHEDERMEAAGTTAEIGIVGPDGTGERVLVAVPIHFGGQPNWVCWTPDSRGVFYLADDADGVVGLWVVPVAGGSPERLLTFDTTIRPHQTFAVYGDTVYVELGQGDIRIRLAELSHGG